jgi:hypothetical protein
MVGCLFFGAQHAGEECQLGTVVVAIFQKHQVSIAADSRVTDILTGEIRDDQCKITALSNKLVFSYAGLGVLRNRPVANEEAVSAIRISSANDITPQVAREIAQVWQARMVKKFREAAIVNPAVLDYPDFPVNPKVGGEQLIAGMFASTTKDGTVVVAVAMINFSVDTWKQRRDFTPVLPEPTVMSGVDGQYAVAAIGTFPTVMEFYNQTTPRAKRIMRQFMSELTLTPEVSKVPKFADKLATVQRDYGNAPEVGGPIDVIDLNGLGWQWIKHKQNCN